MAEALSERQQQIPRGASSGQRPDTPTLRELVAERDRLTETTGHYYGITDLSLRDADPIKYERFYTKMHSAVLATRESARFVAASPGSREMAALKPANEIPGPAIHPRPDDDGRDPARAHDVDRRAPDSALPLS